MIKVCHVTSCHDRKDSRVFRKQCVTLAQNGYDVTFLVNDDLPDESVDNVKIQSLGKYFKNRLTRFLFASNTLYKPCQSLDADVYVFHDPELLTLALKIKKLGKKCIFDSHENYPEFIREKRYIPKFLRGIVSGYVKKKQRRVFKKIDAVFTVSDDCLEAYRKDYPAAQIYKIPNYSIIKQIDFNSEQYLNRKNNFVYIGTIYSVEVIKRILKAMKAVNGKLILGTWDNNAIELFRDDENFAYLDFRGYVKYEETYKLYLESLAGFNLLLYSPNTNQRKGTMGNTKFFDIMANGIPIICTDFILWKEIVEENKCGICIDPTDLNELESAVKQIVANKEQAFRWGQNARNIVEKHYSWQAQEKGYLRIYEKLLSETQDKSNRKEKQ